jgi:hypothetical protein
MADFFIKRGDTQSPIRRTMLDANGAVVPLDAALSVRFIMRGLFAAALKVDSAAAFVEPRSTGTVEYQWVLADVDTPGEFLAEFEITWPPGKQTFPNKSYITVEIGADLRALTETNPLVTIGQYRLATLDTTSSDVAVSGALIEAQELVEEYLGRPLLEQERTETLLIDRTGRVHPSAVPITSVSVPAGATIDRFTITDVDPDETPAPFFWTDPPAWGTWQPRATVTYVGGFTSATLPTTVRRRIIWEAYYMLHVEALADVPVDATGAQIGDAAVSFGPGGPQPSLTPDTRKMLRPWRKP